MNFISNCAKSRPLYFLFLLTSLHVLKIAIICGYVVIRRLVITHYNLSVVVASCNTCMYIHHACFE